LTTKQLVIKLLKNLIGLAGGLSACALLLVAIYYACRGETTYIATDSYPDEVGLGVAMGAVAFVTVPMVLIIWVWYMLYSSVVNWSKSRLYSILNVSLTAMPFLCYLTIQLNDKIKERQKVKQRDASILTPQLEKLSFKPYSKIIYAYSNNGSIYFLTADSALPEGIHKKPVAMAYTSFTENISDWRKSGFELLGSIDTTTLVCHVIDNGRINACSYTTPVVDAVWHEYESLYSPDSSVGGHVFYKHHTNVKTIWYRIKNNSGTLQNPEQMPIGFDAANISWPFHYNSAPFYTNSITGTQFYAVKPVALTENEHGKTDKNVYVAVFVPGGVKVYRFAPIDGSYPITMLPAGNMVYVFYQQGVYRFKT
jgi:hypothetical protein